MLQQIICMMHSHQPECSCMSRARPAAAQATRELKSIPTDAGFGRQPWKAHRSAFGSSLPAQQSAMCCAYIQCVWCQVSGAATAAALPAVFVAGAQHTELQQWQGRDTNSANPTTAMQQHGKGLSSKTNYRESNTHRGLAPAVCRELSDTQ